MAGLGRRQLEYDLLGAQEVADYLGVQPGTVRAYLARGQIVEPLVTLACGSIWLRADVEAWRQTRRNKRIPA